jgi:hypothetical protein
MALSGGPDWRSDRGGGSDLVDNAIRRDLPRANGEPFGGELVWNADAASAPTIRQARKPASYVGILPGALHHVRPDFPAVWLNSANRGAQM